MDRFPGLPGRGRRLGETPSPAQPCRLSGDAPPGPSAGSAHPGPAPPRGGERRYSECGSPVVDQQGRIAACGRQGEAGEATAALKAIEVIAPGHHQ